jgi:hypothetical protein
MQGKLAQDQHLASPSADATGVGLPPLRPCILTSADSAEQATCCGHAGLGAVTGTVRRRFTPPADRQVGEHDGEAGTGRVALRWQTGRAGGSGSGARKPFPMSRKSWWLMAELRCELKAAAFGATTRGTRCHRVPSVAVRETADVAHRPSWGTNPVRYTSVNTATQRSTARQGDTRWDREKRPASARIRSQRAVFADGGRCWVRTNVG